MKRLFFIAIFLLIPLTGYAQQAPVQANVVAACGTPNGASYVAGQNRPATQDTTGKLCTDSVTIPSGTQDTNLKQVNGATVNVGTGAASTGTQRVTTSSDSTLGLVAGSALIGAVDTSGSVGVTPTVQNAAYASGNDIGGLVSFTLPRTASGILQSVALQFIGGATTTINAFCFDSNPSGSTFTDKSTFTIAAADETKRINKTAIGLTPAAASGDSVTGAEQNQYAMPFNSTATIYCAYASTGTFTPASTTDMRATIRFLQGAQ